MPAPTKAALERKPQAVVTQQFVKDHPTVVHTLDFEWFETNEGRTQWYDECAAWMAEDVKQQGDIFYTITEVTDTASMTMGRVQAYGPDEDWQHKAAAAVVADPNTSLIAPAVARKATASKKAPAKKAAVKGRKASAAAAVVKGPVADNTPEVKSKAVRPKKAATTTEAVAAPAASTAGSDKRAAALKARLAAKQAEGGPTPAPAKRTAAKKAAAPVGPKTD